MGITFFAIASLAVISLFQHGECEDPSSKTSTIQRSLRGSGEGTDAYYMGFYPSDFYNAQDYCQSKYGKNYQLATIDSSTDLKKLNLFLENYVGSDIRLWVGGIWQPERNSWIWQHSYNNAEKDVDFSSFALSLFPRKMQKPKVLQTAAYELFNRDLGNLYPASPTEFRMFVCEKRRS